MIRKRDFFGEVAKVEKVIVDFIFSFVKRNIKTRGRDVRRESKS